MSITTPRMLLSVEEGRKKLGGEDHTSHKLAKLSLQATFTSNILNHCENICHKRSCIGSTLDCSVKVKDSIQREGFKYAWNGQKNTQGYHC